MTPLPPIFYRTVRVLFTISFPLWVSIYVGCKKQQIETPKKSPSLSASLQLLWVEVPTWNSQTGTLQRYERASLTEPFRKVGTPLPVWVGRNGVAWPSETGAPPLPEASTPLKREGDGRSPIGLITLSDLWGYAGFPPRGVTWPYHPSDWLDRCVDDVASPDYAQLRRAHAENKPPWNSDEHLRMSTDHYKYMIVLEYNMKLPKPGAGSCIFLHVAPPPGKPTAGCTALVEEDLLTVLRWLEPKKKPILVQLPTSAKDLVLTTWNLSHLIQ